MSRVVVMHLSQSQARVFIVKFTGETGNHVRKTIFIFTSNGLGQTDNAELKLKLAKKFLALLAETDPLPAQVCFYTDGVRLCVNGSPVLDELRRLAEKGVELVLCSTCLDTLGLRELMAVGVVGGMGDNMAAMTQADKVVTL